MRRDAVVWYQNLFGGWAPPVHMPCQFGIYDQKQSANSVQNARCDHLCFFVMEIGIDQAVGISKAMAYGSCKLRNTERK